jgi:hypothetical protein
MLRVPAYRLSSLSSETRRGVAVLGRISSAPLPGSAFRGGGLRGNRVRVLGQCNNSYSAEAAVEFGVDGDCGARERHDEPFDHGSFVLFDCRRRRPISQTESRIRPSFDPGLAGLCERWQLPRLCRQGDRVGQLLARRTARRNRIRTAGQQAGMKTEAQLREAALPPSSAPPPGARSKKGCRRRARGQSHSLGFFSPSSSHRRCERYERKLRFPQPRPS